MGSVGNFDDIIAEFSKKYCAYVVVDWKMTEDGGRKNFYKKVDVWGSLQPGGRRKILKSDGSSVIENTYDFYANKKYILNEDDYIEDKKGNILIINSLDPWENEGDYRKYSLLRTTRTETRDLVEFLGETNPEENIPNEELSKILKEKLLK